MFSKYIEKSLKRAQYKLLKDGTYFGEVSGLLGVWANARDLETCRQELREVLEDWVLLKVSERERIPGFRFHVRRQLVKYA